ncbi:MAG: D-aminoacyl-tRNA deacylase [Leptospiraceae bacterium]|nr:MAG: D-aminoacyl-tRNA deacylase [Leptospiraceae bacterium]
MKIVLQRVKEASVYIVEEKNFSAKINNGLVALIGFCKEDQNKSYNDYKKIAKKILNLRIFEDENNKMNLSLIDIKGQIIIVSQFTLCADPYQGNRPSFTNSLEIDIAQKLYEDFIHIIKEEYIKNFKEKFIKEISEIDLYVQSGKFRTQMQVQLINDGPVTILLEY